MKPLQDDILTLRAVEVTDVDAMMQWENDSSQWESCNTSAPFSRKQLWDYAVNYSNDIYSNGAIRLVVVLRATGALIGCVDIYDFNRFHNRAAVGLYIDSGYRGKGYGIRSMRIAVHYACEFLGMHQVVAEVACVNLASIRMLTACGFEVCGTMKGWFRRNASYTDAKLMLYTSK